MAAPDGIVWGSIKGSYGRIGIYTSISNNEDLTSTVTIQVWFWSKYSVSDENNTYRFDNNATSASTNLGDVVINTTNNSGSGWNVANQILLKTHKYTYKRTTNTQTIYCAAKLSGVDKVSDGGTMSVSTSYKIPAIPVYTISYNANGGSGAPASQTKVHGTAITIPTTVPTRSGYAFLGWNSSSTATSATYSAGGSFTANKTVTLYAVWSADSFIVSYNANGGSGAPASQTKKYGVALTLSTTKPTRTNYTFLGWGVSANSTTVAYSAGGSYTNNASITLYAIWESSYSGPIISVSGLSRVDKKVEEDDAVSYVPNDLSTIVAMKIKSELDASATTRKVTVEWKPISEEWENNINERVSTKEFSISTYGYGPLTFTAVIGEAKANDNEETAKKRALSADCTYEIRITVEDGIGKTSITLTLPSTAYTMDFLSGGKGVAFGKQAELPSVIESNWSIVVNDGVISTKNLVVSNAANIKILRDELGTRYANGLAAYGGATAPIDPNTTLEHLVLTNTNTPNGGFMYIKTEFYNSKSETSNRVQTALPYNTDSTPYMRRYVSGTWTSWIPLHAGKADVVGGSALGTFSGNDKSIDTTGNVNAVKTWTVLEDGVYGITANFVWDKNSTGYRVLQVKVEDASGNAVGKSIGYVKQFIAGSVGVAQNVAGFRRLTKNHKVVLYAAQNSGAALYLDTWTMDIVKISP